MKLFFNIYSLLLISIILNNNITFSQVTQMWIQRYSQSGNSLDVASSIVVDKNGSTFVTGSSGISTNPDIVTIKYSNSGNQIWLQRYNGLGNGTDIGMKSILDHDGSLIVTGESEGIGTNSDYVTLKYSTSGEILWERRYVSGGSDQPSSVNVDNLNNVYVTGKSNSNFATIKYNSSGIQQWVSLYPAPYHSDFSYAIVVDDLGNVSIAGENDGDCITIKYDSLGIEKWVEIYKGKANRQDFGNSIGVDGLGNVYVSGSSIENPNTYGGYLCIKYNPDGVQQWVRFYEGTSNFFHVARSMKVDSSGNAYVTGYSTETGQGYNYTTIKYNTYGDTIWRASYNKGSNDIAYALALDNYGNVYITGKSDGNGTEEDYATVKYNSFGIQQWVKRYDYSEQIGDYGYSIAADNSSNIYVTGSSNRDFLTIKYSQPTNIEPSFEIPSEFRLEQNYPNPFNPATIINYELRITNYISLKVYDALGNQIATLVNQKQSAGSYKVQFDGSNYPSGVYFYRLMANGNDIDTKTMLLLK